MKLQNKETGEIRKGEAREDGIYLYDEITGQWYKYELDLLARGWKYYEEPKKYWYISRFGYVIEDTDENLDADKKRKEIGNYFETREEAEKAVEKLKALKRLKDAGVSFNLATVADETTITIFARKKNSIHDYDKDIFTIFGGEE